jgi:zona occludens toxin (predicted ATPase)
LKGDILDTETGELLQDVDYDINDLESATKRKKKAIKRYSDFYEPLYQQRKVSCMFITLTQANIALTNTNIRDAINLIRKRFERHNIQVLGHLWVSEISYNGHWHYHIAISTTRVRWKKIPSWAKFNDIWGRRTQIEFIRKSVASYLGKYIGKDNMGRMIGFRQYGISRNLKSPIEVF